MGFDILYLRPPVFFCQYPVVIDTARLQLCSLKQHDRNTDEQLQKKDPMSLPDTVWELYLFSTFLKDFLLYFFLWRWHDNFPQLLPNYSTDFLCNFRTVETLMKKM